MSPQTSYPLNMDPAVAGQLYDTGPNDVITMNNPAIAVLFGQAVEKIATDEDGIKLPDNGAPDIWGIAIKDPSETEDYYPVLSAIGVVTKGRIYVPVEEAVTPDDSVFVRFNGIAQVQTYVLDADLVALNIITVTVDGNVLTETYAASHNTTMGLFAAQIQAQASVNTAVFGTRTITVTSVIGNAVAVTVLADEGITLGVSQAGIVITETTAGVPYEDRGKFRTDVDGGTAVAWTGAKYIKGAAAGALAVVEVSVP